MNTFLGIFLFLQLWTIFVLLGRVGITGLRRVLWCVIAAVPFLWLFALCRVAFFKWPSENLSNTPAVDDVDQGKMVVENNS